MRNGRWEFRGREGDGESEGRKLGKEDEDRLQGGEAAVKEDNRDRRKRKGKPRVLFGLESCFFTCFEICAFCFEGYQTEYLSPPRLGALALPHRGVLDGFDTRSTRNAGKEGERSSFSACPGQSPRWRRLVMIRKGERTPGTQVYVRPSCAAPGLGLAPVFAWKERKKRRSTVSS